MADTGENSQAKKVRPQDAEDKRDTSRRVRHWRQQAGLKQFELAQRLDMSEPSVSRWENESDPAIPPTIVLHHIAEICGVSMQIFWGVIPGEST